MKGRKEENRYSGRLNRISREELKLLTRMVVEPRDDWYRIDGMREARGGIGGIRRVERGEGGEFREDESRAE